MRAAAALVALAFTASIDAQTLPPRCQTQEVGVAESTVDLRILACAGEPQRAATGKGAVVYVCDTGVMQTHDEFMRAEGSVVIAGIDPVPNGYGRCARPAVDPCWSNDGTLGIFGHGTATASVIAGRNTGIAPDAKIVSVYVENVGTRVDRWIRTLDAIIAHAWDPATPQFRTAIVNMSFAVNLASMNDPKFAQFERKMRDMIGGVDRDGNPDPSGKRFLFVTVAGNHAAGSAGQCDANLNTNLFPATLGSSIDGLITVGGTDNANRIWERSCRGDAVDVYAPAVDVFVASISAHDHYRSGHVPYAGYPQNSGTSYAAPFVAGAAALLLEEYPDLTPAELEGLIKSGGFDYIVRR
ncbi:MAG TPA: S8 family serine peptidase [Thermoanaerobaculia bacterium]|nr:S8 family serine peptidase [Thermoanaerobaculia bacterium]